MGVSDFILSLWFKLYSVWGGYFLIIFVLYDDDYLIGCVLYNSFVWALAFIIDYLLQNYC